jgi:DNA mismatch repair protein MutL
LIPERRTKVPSIIRLSQQVADLIAAGEVVERPASAAKELIENSLDAGAKHITVEIQGGGIALLRVTDDGKGISADEVETAFLRHATSKLRTKEDLEAIATMGFRGEALAAISAVAKVELLTKTEEAPFGRRVELAGGEVLSNEEAGCPKGTTIVLKDLFYNTPARHKFLKKDVTEAGYVLSVCQRTALARPDVAFTFIKNGEITLQTPGDGQLKTVIYCLFGNSMAEKLLPVAAQHENITVSGFVGRPEAARGSRSMQYFLVNERPVKNGTLQSAVEQAFRKQLTVGRFPAAFLHVSIHPGQLDVNIHPAKTEVKFAREKDVFDAVYYAVKTALSESEMADFAFQRPSSMEKKAEITAKTPMAVQFREDPTLVRGDLSEDAREYSSAIYKKHKNSPNGDDIIRESNLAQSGMVSLAALGILAEPSAPAKPNDKTELQAQAKTMPPAYAEPEWKPSATVRPAVPLAVEVFEETPMQKPPTKANEEAAKAPDDTEVSWRFVGEAMGTYIIAERGDTLCLMDKHAAHERLVYEQLKKEADLLPAQLLLEAPVLHLEARETAVLLENRATLLRLGFEIEEFGGGSLRLLSIPSVLDQAENPSALLSELADQLSKGKEPGLAAMDQLLSMIACKSSVRARDEASPQELMHLFLQVIEDETLWYCPHGRPVLTMLTKKELEKQFKRLV